MIKNFITKIVPTRENIKTAITEFKVKPLDYFNILLGAGALLVAIVSFIYTIVKSVENKVFSMKDFSGLAFDYYFNSVTSTILLILFGLTIITILLFITINAEKGARRVVGIIINAVFALSALVTFLLYGFSLLDGTQQDKIILFFIGSKENTDSFFYGFFSSFYSDGFGMAKVILAIACGLCVICLIVIEAINRKNPRFEDESPSLIRLLMLAITTCAVLPILLWIITNIIHIIILAAIAVGLFVAAKIFFWGQDESRKEEKNKENENLTDHQKVTAPKVVKVGNGVKVYRTESTFSGKYIACENEITTGYLCSQEDYDKGKVILKRDNGQIINV